MSRGDRGEDIFLEDVGRRDFLKTLAVALDCQSAILATANRRCDNAVGLD
jgi:hypothetical protein